MGHICQNCVFRAFEVQRPLANVRPRNKQVTLSLKLGGRDIEAFELNGAQLIQDCASIGAKIARKLLTSEEHDFEQVESPARDDISDKSHKAAPGLTERALVATEHNESPSWESMKRAIIPQYVQRVSFAVGRDLRSDDREDLHARFPDVTIIEQTTPENCPAGGDGDIENELESQFAADARPDRSTQTEWNPPLLDTSITTVVEVVPSSTLVATTPRPSLLSRMSIDEPELRIKGIVSGSVEEVHMLTSPRRRSNSSEILCVADRIGFQISSPPKVIHAIWAHWKNNREVKSFAQVRQLVNLQRYYSNLVTLYILAHHKMESDLCFAVLLRIQNTNYAFPGQLPDVQAAVLAFQYLPEDSDLCRWIAILFAFLWGTQQYQDHGHLLVEFPDLDRDALSKLLFAVAHIRDPFTKGHDTAVLESWCEVHHHREGDNEELKCREVRDSMKSQFDKMKADDAKRDYEEAQVTVRNYVKNLELQNVDTPEPGTSDDRPWTTKSKRKAESPAIQPTEKYKRVGGRGGGRGGFGRASS